MVRERYYGWPQGVDCSRIFETGKIGTETGRFRPNEELLVGEDEITRQPPDTDCNIVFKNLCCRNVSQRKMCVGWLFRCVEAIAGSGSR